MFAAYFTSCSIHRLLPVSIPRLVSIRCFSVSQRSLESEPEPERSLSSYALWKRRLQATDPEKYERYLKKKRDYYRLRLSDPDFHQRNQRSAKSFKEQRRARYRIHLQSEALYGWVIRYPEVRKLEWSTHDPIHYPEKVEHFCSSCGFTHFRGKRLWWRRKSDPKLYDCHTSFTSDWSRALPRGYEHVVFGDHTRKLKQKKTSKEPTTTDEQKSSGSQHKP